MNFQFTPPPKKLKAFTLAEVLITLVIIGVVAAITVPSLMQSTQDKEFHSALKKNFSALQNVLKLAQVQEGLMGDNTAIFAPSSDSNASYESAKKFAKYVNTVKVCKDSNDTGCDGVYYPIKFYGASVKEPNSFPKYPAVVLTDGSIYKILQYENCGDYMDSCVTNSAGDCVTDDNGDITEDQWYRNDCAVLYIDVNGAKGPNKFGKDVFDIRVRQDKVKLGNWAASGGTPLKNILLNKK